MKGIGYVQPDAARTAQLRTDRVVRHWRRPLRTAPDLRSRRSGRVRDGARQVRGDRSRDTQIKRIHEYKRQLLNALHIVVLYQRLRENRSLAAPPRTFFFAGKAAPAYAFAKLVIKFINNIA